MYGNVLNPAAAFIDQGTFSWLIRGESSNSRVHDPLLCKGTPKRPLKDIPQGPTWGAFAAAALTKDLRNELWMYDVVTRLERLHHVEAAVACAVEKPPEVKQNLT